MAYLEVGGQRHPIEQGDSYLGSDASCAIRLEGEGIAPRHAMIQQSGEQVAVRIVTETHTVLINSVPLGPQPHPLIHGDKIGVGSYELLFGDEASGGSTQYVSAVDAMKLAEMAERATSRPKAATAATGGRLVCLTDGREYEIAESLSFGREAGNDVVVTSKNVSRRHGEVVVTPDGYVFIDTSTNGSFINGERVEGQKLLSRADVIRIGDEDFRFYADVAKPSPPPSPQPVAATPESPAALVAPVPPSEPVAPAAPSVPATPPAPPVPAVGADEKLRNTAFGIPSPTPEAGPLAGAPAGAEHRLNDTLMGMPGTGKASAPPPAAPPTQPVAATPPAAPAPPATPAAARHPSGPAPLAYVVVRSGTLQGQRLPVRVPIVNIGRADYNDIVLPEDSVSTIHAKLQRREGMWFLVDLESTNGTFVDGEKVEGDVPLAPGAVVRFGEVKTFFEPTDDTVDPAKGSSTKMMGAIKIPPRPPGS